MSYSIIINPNSGIAGDMFSASLIHALKETNDQGFIDIINQWEINLKEFYKGISKNSSELKISKENVSKKGINAVYLTFQIKNLKTKHRSAKEIISMFKNSKLSIPVKETALNILNILIEAECKIHGKKPSEIHLHEAGGEDSILDILSAAYLFEALKKPKIFSSELIESFSGKTIFSHGEVPLPVPATAEIIKNIPISFTSLSEEMITPTGAAILKGLNVKFSIPKNQYKIISIGYGAGFKNFIDRPNVLRALLIEEIK
ncbi:MAG: LarC family nickel insertion protein [Spirochaetia bacterium]|nr:LarC family nickel insertion protein [Spirochaetia bacterium]